MLKKYFKSMKPLHLILAVLLFFVALTIIVLILKTINLSDFISKTENKTFDSRQVMLVNNHVKKPNKDIVIVAIDDASYEYLTNKYGEWPLPRTVYADLIHFLEKQNPMSISFDLMFVSSLKSKVGADDKLANAMNSYDNILKYSFYRKTGWSLTTHPPSGQIDRRNSSLVVSYIITSIIHAN